NPRLRGTRHVAEGGIPQPRVYAIELRMVEKIEALEPDRYDTRFFEMDILKQSQIPVVEAGATNDPVRGVAKGRHGRDRECGGVEPVVECLRPRRIPN